MKAKYSCGSIIGNDVSIISGTLGLSAVGFVECIGTFRYMGSGMWGRPMLSLGLCAYCSHVAHLILSLRKLPATTMPALGSSPPLATMQFGPCRLHRIAFAAQQQIPYPSTNLSLIRRPARNRIDVLLAWMSRKQWLPDHASGGGHPCGRCGCDLYICWAPSRQ